MPSTMLIDAAHPEETRVVVCDQNRVDEFDFESASKKQLRGNIYLARVTRVEPSLQAAFVEFGGNRHGFLAFDEIHPDYYQIPHEDRLALMEEERQAVAAATRAAAAAEGPDDDAESPEPEAEAGEGAEAAGHQNADDDGDDGEDPVDAALAQRRQRLLRKYKIQEVIKRRQILLVQVVKEERGNKGAALTTYLSLAGRYCVLMPNTARGGGISRKITSAADRKRLKKVVAELDTPDGMGLIVRTAGAKRTKAEIKRDYDYLLRLWETIRTQTLNSIAPCLIYEESNLVKRAIRDLYDKDIEAVLVAGDGAYREAKDFIRMLMPSHAKKVQPYREPSPIFTKYRIEDQLEQIYNQTVQLKSGGYIVINQTEALVSIDVNSGRATRERNVEATATKTNLEAAEEIARQMRLRDLAGLIVIDFIDMEEQKNVRNVEKRMRDCLKRDRARLQVAKISQFGLMEISRQRRRASVLEGSHATCPTCEGRGVVRSVESSALHVIRALEDEAFRGRAKVVRLRLPTTVALYLLNEKRAVLTEIERLYEVRVLVEADPALIPPAHEIVRLELRSTEELEDFTQRIAKYAPVFEPEPADVAFDEDDADEDQDEAADTARAPRADRAPRPDAEEASGDTDASGRRRRRRRRRGGRGLAGEGEGDLAARTPREDDDAADLDGADHDLDGEEPGEDGRADERTGDGDGEGGRRRRRRGRRGGRNRSGRAEAPAPAGMEVVEVEGAEVAPAPWDDAGFAHDPGQPRPGQTRPSRAAALAAEAAEVERVLDAGTNVTPPIASDSPAAEILDAPIIVASADAVFEATTPSAPDPEAVAAPDTAVTEPAPEAAPEPVPAKRPRRSRAKAASAEPVVAEPVAAGPVAEEAPAAAAAPPPRNFEVPAAEAPGAEAPSEAVVGPARVAAEAGAERAAPPPPPPPIDTERRQRWQDRLKSWISG